MSDENRIEVHLTEDPVTSLAATAHLFATMAKEMALQVFEAHAMIKGATGSVHEGLQQVQAIEAGPSYFGGGLTREEALDQAQRQVIEGREAIARHLNRHAQVAQHTQILLLNVQVALEAMKLARELGSDVTNYGDGPKGPRPVV